MIKSIDMTSISLESGPGPALIGHYMNAAEYRVAAALLSAIGSAISDPMVAIVADIAPEDLVSPVAVRGGGEVCEISIEEVRNSLAGGWVTGQDRSGVIFLPTDRASMEDCIYRSFLKNECFIAPASLRKRATSVNELEKMIRVEKLVEVTVDYSEIEITVYDDSVRQIMFRKTARVIEEFNQL